MLNLISTTVVSVITLAFLSPSAKAMEFYSFSQKMLELRCEVRDGKNTLLAQNANTNPNGIIEIHNSSSQALVEFKAIGGKIRVQKEIELSNQFAPDFSVKLRTGMAKDQVLFTDMKSGLQVAGTDEMTVVILPSVTRAFPQINKITCKAAWLDANGNVID